MQQTTTPGTSHGLTRDQVFVAERYDQRADAYVTSVVHAEGADLEQIGSLLAVHRPVRLLDLGCGGGHVSYRAAAHAGEVVACDPSAAMLQAVRDTAAARGLGRITTRQAAAEQLPFEDAAFDAVVSRFSAHHWQDLARGLGEAARVLRRGGLAIFIDTIAPPAAALDSHLQAVELLRDPTHGRDYTALEWLEALCRAGFAPGQQTLRRLRMEFASWTARTATPASQAAAIRVLQDGAAESVHAHFAIEADGSFELEALTLVASRL